MKNSLTLFLIKGIPIKVHWTFLLFISWIMLMQLIAREDIHTISTIISEVLIVFICVLLHELGHALTAIHYKIPIKEIQLLPVGGLTFFKKQPSGPQQEIMVSMAGPLVNIIISLSMIPLLPASSPFWQIGKIFTNIHAANIFQFIYNVNIILAIINLVPALPLDGGKILKGILGLLLSTYKAFQTTLIITRIISILLTFAGLITGNLLFILYGGFLLFISTIEKDNFIITFLLKNESVSDVLSKDFKTIPLQASREELLNTICTDNDRYYVLTDNGNMVGILDKETILFSLLTSKKEVLLKNIIIPDITPVHTDNKLIDIWNQLPSKPDIFMPVISSANNVVGVISRDNIISTLLHEAVAAHKKPFALGLIVPLCFSILQADTNSYYSHSMSILQDTPTLSRRLSPLPPLDGFILLNGSPVPDEAQKSKHRNTTEEGKWTRP
jgi:Zn-dependent protease